MFALNSELNFRFPLGSQQRCADCRKSVRLRTQLRKMFWIRGLKMDFGKRKFADAD